MSEFSTFLREADIEGYLRSRVTRLGGRSYKFVSPSTCGVPDRIVVAPGGQVWFVEVKAPRGKLSRLQKLVIDDLQSMGAQVAVVYDKAEVDALLSNIFNDTEAQHGQDCKTATD